MEVTNTQSQPFDMEWSDVVELTGVERPAIESLLSEVDPRKQLGVLARLAVLAEWTRFSEGNGIGKTEAGWRFPKVFAAGEADLPEWVYNEVRKVSY